MGQDRHRDRGVTQFDVVVVGGGHAGCEAAAAAARLGRTTALIVLQRAQIGRLSCNPAIGGQAKGHLVREIDALGGLMGRVADRATVAFRYLNTRKGLAVRSSRAQVDVDRYPAEMQAALAVLPNLTVVQGEVVAVRTANGQVVGVRLADGTEFGAGAVVLTTGTFLGGVLFRGEARTAGGRVGDGAATALSDDLKALGLRVGRLKTGTVPRLDGRTIDWEKTEPQQDDVVGAQFSFGPPAPVLPRIQCSLTWTTPAVHELILANLHRSPMASGNITGRGPRYCPCVEDKVVRFADRSRHLLYLEPEGLNTHRVYVNGLSTSLPEDVQADVVHGIQGLERATIVQYGYAVEYDYADPTDLDPGLMFRALPGLYLAGQINGTSGYEEAAAQGLIAGLSAALGEPFVVGRDEGYIGVLVNDLVTRGVGGEPYRMFTSRAEHRLILREDDADRRLTPRARALGLVDDVAWARFETRVAALESGRAALTRQLLCPTADVLARLAAFGLGGLDRAATAEEILRRPEASWAHVSQLVPLPELSRLDVETVEQDVKYAGYIARARRRAHGGRRVDSVAIPASFDWFKTPGLSTETRERASQNRPTTIGVFAALPGVTPAAVDTVLAHLAWGAGTEA